MFEYYTELRRESGLPVLPIGLYLRVGLDGIGWDAYEEHFWEHPILRFEYAYVGLPGLKADDYVIGEHLLGVALTSLMRTSPEQRVKLYAESLKRIAMSGENDFRRYLLTECLESYVKLDETQQEKFQELMGTELYREARPFMITTYERGKADGKLEGMLEGREEGKLEDRRETAILLLETKFGSLSSKVHQRIAEMAPQQLRQLLVNVVKVPSLSLKELQLDD